MGISFGGLSSGLDTNGIIAQLMALERRPKLRLEVQQRQAEARQTLLRDIAARLRALDTAARDLRSTATWADAQNVTSSDSTRVQARLSGSAGAGGYQVEVTQLARAEQRTYAYTASSSATQIDIDGVLIDVAANATLQDVVDAINAGATGVSASAVDGRLVLTSRQTGAANGFTASGATLAEDAAKARIGLDAQYTVDGVAGTCASNVVGGAIAGVELTLQAVTSGAVTVNVSAPAPDPARITAKVEAFVKAYNEATDLIRTETAERKVRSPSTRFEEAQGVLSGDSMLRGVLSRMRLALMEIVGGNPSDLDELAEIGVSTGATTGGGTVSADAVAGRLVLDSARLADALSRDPAAVERLLAGDGSTEGIAARLGGVLAPITGAGGILDTRISAADSQISRLRGAIGDMERRLSLREEALVRQFAAMEKALADSQAQGNWLAGQLQALLPSR